MESCNRKGLAMRKWLLGRITDALTLEGGMPVVRVKTTEREYVQPTVKTTPLECSLQ